jgi:hypothetical protein
MMFFIRHVWRQALIEVINAGKILDKKASPGYEAEVLTLYRADSQKHIQAPLPKAHCRRVIFYCQTVCAKSNYSGLGSFSFYLKGV